MDSRQDIVAVAEKEPLGSGPKRALGTLAAEDDLDSLDSRLWT